MESFFSIGWDDDYSICVAHHYFRTIIVIPDTKEGGIRTSTYLLATSDASRNALFYQRFQEKNNATLTSVVIRNELSKDLVFNTRKFQFGRQQDSLKAYKLKHSYYNMIEQGSTTLQLEFETS
jgi:hypothetical protein